MFARIVTVWSLVLVLAVACAAPAPAQTERRVPQSRAEIALSFSPLVKQVGPAVVNVYSRTTVTEAPGLSPLFDDPFFKRFFGAIMPRLPERRRAANAPGSGVSVDPRGLVVTTKIGRASCRERVCQYV